MTTLSFLPQRRASLPCPAAMVVACAFFAVCAVAQQAAINPYTYLGRVMDAEHIAFDSNRVATISAYDASGRLLARTASTFRSTSRNNYRLDIPVASSAVSGSATVGAVLAISAVDENGKTWAGLVVDEGRTDGTAVGEPGGVRQVDLVLAMDRDGDGLDDTLVSQYRDAWEAWRAWQDDYDPNEQFDLSKDYDGDGASTRDEILAGTNPFSADQVLRITNFVQSPASGTGLRTTGNETGDAATPGFAITFPAIGGHAYTLQSATSPTGTWETVKFQTSPGGAPLTVLSLPNTTRSATPTVYLAPVSAPAAFFRVRCE